MSRIGKKLVVVPDGVTVTASEASFAVKGPKGELTMPLPKSISLKLVDNTCEVVRTGDSRNDREMHGTIRSYLVNMIGGVTVGYKKVLDIQGIGYRGELQGAKLVLHLGKSNPIEFPFPAGIEIVLESNTRINVCGINKEKVGSAAAKIRNFYPPEPYKGKGIKYQDETVRRKAGKTVAGG